MKKLRLLLPLFALSACLGCSARAEGFIESAHGIHFNAHQWIAQQELTVNPSGCCGTDFEDVRDRRVQFTREYIFPTPMETEQITISYRSNCFGGIGPLVLWVLYDPVTKDYLTAPLIMQERVNGTLTVPVNFTVHGLGMNVTAGCDGTTELLILGESKAH